MQTINEAIRLWKTHGWALAKMRVGKTRSTNGMLNSGCQSNRMKKNDGATSIMRNYHSQRQKKTMRSFKNKTSNA